MSLLSTLTTDMKTAMKARDSERLDTVRLLISELKKHELDHGELNEKIELEILSRAAKQRRESITAYENAGRDELAAKEKSELSIIATYLPEQLTKADVEAMAREVIDATGVASMKEMGKVMGQLMPRLKGRFPGKDVGPIVSALLS